MKSRRFLLALATSLGALTAALAATSAPAVPTLSPGAMPPTDTAHLAQSKALFSEKCSACHNLPDPVGESKTRAEWQRTVNTMLGRYHASDSISSAEAGQIVDYLATFAPPADTPGSRTNDPWATDDTDVWTVMPSISRVFNFVSPGALSEFGAVSAGAPGPAPIWHLVTENVSPDGTAAQVRLVNPNPDRFGLLLDRRDQARNLDVQVRFHIAAGKVSPSVGIVFGYADAQNYSVLSYNQTHGTLTLIQISGTTHTALQQTPIALPSSGTTAAQVTSAPSSGWHTLRLLVKDGQVRGWLDRNKRISVSDAAYQGGKLGLWAQGDTIAAFQDWTVDVYDGAATQGDSGA